MSVRDTLKQAVGDTAIYSLGVMLSRVVSILMVPLYTHYLDPAHYGTVEMVVLTADLFATFLSMQVGGAIIRFYYDAKDRDQLARVMGTGLILASLSGILLAGIGGLIARPLAHLLLPSADQAPYFRIVFVTSGLSGIVEVALLRYRAAQRPAAYVGWSLVITVLGLALNIFFIVFLGWGIEGILYSGLITQGTIAAVLVAATIRAAGVSFDRGLLNTMFRFVYPLAFNGLGSFVVQYGDRFVLRMFYGLDILGIYGLAYKFALGTNSLLTVPFMGFWSAKAVELHREGRYGQAPHIVRLYLVLWCGAATVISVFSPQIVGLLAPPEYAKAAAILPVLLIGMLGFTVAQFMAQTLINHKLTWRVARARVATAVLNILLNLALVPAFGAMGSAWSTAATFVVLAGLNWWEAERAEHVPYEIGRIAGLLAVSVAWGVIGFALLPRTPGPWPWVWRGVLVALLPPTYALVGAVSKSECGEAWALMGRFTQRTQ